jgi:hypothetical protein
MKILVKYPSRSRPKRFFEVLMTWISNADDISRLHFLFSFDSDDTTMVGMGEQMEALIIDATVVYGYSASKVEAINRDFQHAPEDWEAVIVVSDDMHCVYKGWDRLIEQRCKQHPDHLIWFPDQKQQSMCTLPCMDRAYYERDGWIYDPRFKSVFCDDLQTDVAHQRERLHYTGICIAHHLHPANVSNVVPDFLYRKNETSAIWKHDEALYRKLTPYPRK